MTKMSANLPYYLELAWRAILRDKWLSALMVAALAVGIGACLTTTTVFHVLSGDPLPGRSQNVFYVQSDGDPQHRSADAPWDLLDYRTAKDLAGLSSPGRYAMVASSAATVSRPDRGFQPLAGHFLATNRGFFEMFRPPFAFGGTWSIDDETRRSRVAVLSHEANMQLFGGGNSVGKTVKVEDVAYRVVGVLAPWRPRPLFYEVAGGALMRDSAATFFGSVEDVMMPFDTAVEQHVKLFNPWYCWRPPTDGEAITSSQGCLWVQLWVWLDTPSAVGTFRRRLTSYADEQQALGRFEVLPRTRLLSLVDWLSYNGVVPDAVRLQLGMAYCFLFICLCNAVGLLFAKFAGRDREFALRRALGATRAAIFAQCVIEAIVVACLGGAAGAALSAFGLMLVRRQPFSYANLAHLDAPMFVVLIFLTLLCGGLVAIVPAARAAISPPAAALSDGGAT